MVVAIVRDAIVENLIVCDSIEMAHSIFPDAICVDGTGLAIGEPYPAQENTPESENSDTEESGDE